MWAYLSLLEQPIGIVHPSQGMPANSPGKLLLYGGLRQAAPVLHPRDALPEPEVAEATPNAPTPVGLCNHVWLYCWFSM